MRHPRHAFADGDGHCVGDLVDGMTVLQHRGQDAAGFTTASTSQDWEKVTFKTVKGTGMVREVFADPKRGPGTARERRYCSRALPDGGWGRVGRRPALLRELSLRTGPGA